jgi:hypothetical protein
MQKGDLKTIAPETTGTSLVSCRSHAQAEEEDSAVEGAKAEGGSDRKGEGWALQRHPVDDPDEARVEGEGKTTTPALTSSDDDMDLLGDDESPLTKGGSPPPIDMYINMVFMLLVEFRGAEEEVAQMCLGPKEVIFKKPKESSQHMKPLYV